MRVLVIKLTIIFFISLSLAIYLQLHHAESLGGSRWDGIGSGLPYSSGVATKHIKYGTPLVFAKFDVEEEIVSSELYNMAERGAKIEWIELGPFLYDVLLYMVVISSFVGLSLFLLHDLIRKYQNKKILLLILVFAFIISFLQGGFLLILEFVTTGLEKILGFGTLLRVIIGLFLFIQYGLFFFLPTFWMMRFVRVILFSLGFTYDPWDKLGFLFGFLLNFLFFSYLWLIFQRLRRHFFPM